MTNDNSNGANLPAWFTSWKVISAAGALSLCPSYVKRRFTSARVHEPLHRQFNRIRTPWPEPIMQLNHQAPYAVQPLSIREHLSLSPFDIYLG
jgi:hypothetical protein